MRLRYDVGCQVGIISSEKMRDIMKVAKNLKDSGLLIKGVTQAIQNETSEQRAGFFGMLLGEGVIRAEVRVIRARQDF